MSPVCLSTAGTAAALPDTRPSAPGRASEFTRAPTHPSRFSARNQPLTARLWQRTMCERSDTNRSRYSSAGMTLNRLNSVTARRVRAAVRGQRRRGCSEGGSERDAPDVSLWDRPTLFECVRERPAHVLCGATTWVNARCVHRGRQRRCVIVGQPSGEATCTEGGVAPHAPVQRHGRGRRLSKSYTHAVSSVVSPLLGTVSLSTARGRSTSTTW